MKTGIELIAEERQRQITAEGWSAAHDDGHEGEQLARAAACYAMPSTYRDCSGRQDAPAGVDIPVDWPWDWGWWKPGEKARPGSAGYIPPTPAGRLRELVKAGALLAAEIDRLQRANAETPKGETVAGEKLVEIREGGGWPTCTYCGKPIEREEPVRVGVIAGRFVDQRHAACVAGEQGEQKGGA